MGMFGFDKQYAMFDVTPLDNQFILEYMPTAKGDFVKVYLYGLLQCYHPQEEMSLAQMSHELGMTEDDILSAYRHWERMGLVERVSDKPPAFRYVNVRQQFFTGEKASVDNDYVNFADSLYAAFGRERSLHTKEISLAYEWVADLGLSTEVVLMLIRHMIALRGRNFSMQSAQKLAAELAEQHATTIEDAEMVLDRNRAVWDGSKAVLRRFGKRRDPSVDEQNLYLKWTRDWGFSADAIEAACAETTKGEPNFAYLDGILRGLMTRQGKAMTSSQQVEQARQKEKDEVEPLKQLLSLMNIRVSINEGTIDMYRRMRRLYPDEVIRLAGRECSVKRNPDMTDVQSLLESWKEKGLKDEAAVRAYVSAFRAQNDMIQSLYELWGKPDRPKADDRKKLARWRGEMHMSDEMIRFCADYAAHADGPMAYLDKLLTEYHERGVTTPQQAAQAHGQWQQEKAEAQRDGGKKGERKGGKVVAEAQYAQREYTHSDDPLMQMMAEWKENQGNAQ